MHGNIQMQHVLHHVLTPGAMQHVLRCVLLLSHAACIALCIASFTCGMYYSVHWHLTLGMMVQGTKTLHYLRKSQLLAVPGVAEHFLETATSLLTFAVASQGSSPPSAGTSAALMGKLSQNVPSDVTVADHLQQFLTFCWHLCCSDRYKLSQHAFCLVTFAVTSQGRSPTSAAVMLCMCSAVAECSVPCESCYDFC